MGKLGTAVYSFVAVISASIERQVTHGYEHNGNTCISKGGSFLQTAEYALGYVLQYRQEFKLKDSDPLLPACVQ